MFTTPPPQKKKKMHTNNRLYFASYDGCFCFSDNLASSANMFRSRSKSLHRNMWWKNCKVGVTRLVEKNIM